MNGKKRSDKPVDYKKYFNLLSRTVEELNSFPLDGDIYTFIAETLKHIVPKDTIILVNSFDQETKTITLHAIEGLGVRQIDVETILCRPLNGLAFSVPDPILPSMLTGECNEIPGGVNELSFGAIPREICEKIEAMPYFGTVYSAGISWKGRLNGAATFILPPGTGLENRDLITFFIRQVAGFLSRIEAEKKLRESEQFTREIIDNAKEGIVVYDRDFNYLVWNLFMESITGVSASEALGKNAFELFPHLRKEKVDVLLQQARDGKTVRSPDTPYLVPYTKKSGWVSGTYSPHVNAQGEIIGIIGNIHEITERKNAQNALIGAKSFLDQILNTIPDPVFVKDNMHRRILVNDAYCRFLRLRREELIKKTDHDLYPHDQADSFTREDNRVFASGIERIIEEQVTDGQGQVHTIVTKKALLVDGLGKRFVVGIARDITEHKRAEKALHIAQEKYTKAFLSSPDAIMISDLETGRFVEINDAASQIYGYSRDEMIGKNALERGIWLRKEDRDALINQVGTQGRVELYEIIERRKNGDLFNASVSADFLTVGNRMHLISVVRDITENKKMENALRQANKKLNLLCSITRHDIKNQLMVLNTYLYLSKGAVDKPDDLKELFAKEQKIADVIANQISFTKDYEEMGMKAPTWQNVHTVIRTVIGRLPMRNICIDTGDPTLEVYADPLLEKVFYNLIDNALKYGGEGMTTIRITNHEETVNLIIVVEDDGSGISKDDKEQLFTKGFGKNTGLGLFLSREILDITGITIRETGEPGKGARFEMTVPKGEYRLRAGE